MNSNLEFYNIIKDIANNETVKQMQNFEHHLHTTCYDHCMNVSYYSYLLTKKLKLNYIDTARACMVHDLFLYSWKGNRTKHGGLHGFKHPSIALENAKKLFNLSSKEQDIILKHMWPMTVILPKYKESYIVSFVDKFCAIKEYVVPFFKLLKCKKVYRYSYLFFAFFLFKVV